MPHSTASTKVQLPKQGDKAQGESTTNTTVTTHPNTSLDPPPPPEERAPSRTKNTSISVSNRSTRRSSSSHHRQTDPVIAPGFGTLNDLKRLAKELSTGGSGSSATTTTPVVVSVEAVQYLMESRGRGGRRGRSSTTAAGGGGVDDHDDANAASTTTTTAPISSAWADFMKEEGVAVATTSTTAQTTPSGTTSKRGRADNQNDTDGRGGGEQVILATSTSSTAESRVYNLDKLKATTTNVVASTTTSTTASRKKSKTTNESSSDLDGAGTTGTISTGGVLVQAGTLDASSVGRSKKLDATAGYTLSVPTRILPLIRIAKVVTAGHACHSLAIATTGIVYGWGRNEAHQLGGGSGSDSLPLNIHQPTVLDDLKDHIVVAAAVGKSHSLVLLQSGEIYAAGLNKSGQCGIKSAALETVLNFRKAVFKGEEDDDEKRIIQVACGEDFSVALCDEGYMYTTGSSEFGQLANGETGEHFITANKIAFTNETAFTKRTTFCFAPTEKLYSNSDASTKVVPLAEDIRIQQVACGKHHAMALEADDANGAVFPRVFTWGCGDYGVLGHGVQANEFFPRCVGILAHTRLPLTGSSHLAVAAGQHCSLLQCANGHVYYWGKHRPVGEATMRPTLVDVLANNGHVVTEMAAGGQSVVCSTANGQTVAWGQCLHGGLGLSDKKSSAKPAFVPGLDSCRVVSLACGYGHSLFVVRDDDKEDKAAVQKIPVLDPLCTNDIAETAPPAAKGKPKKKK